jgi:transposase-like protein
MIQAEESGYQKCGSVATTQEVSLGEDSAAVFTNEFKEEAVKLLIDGTLTIAEAARRLPSASLPPRRRG